MFCGITGKTSKKLPTKNKWSKSVPPSLPGQGLDLDSGEITYQNDVNSNGLPVKVEEVNKFHENYYNDITLYIQNKLTIYEYVIL